MSTYLDIDDAVADHPRAKQELERLRERAKRLYPSDVRERESVCMCSACRNPLALVFDSEAVLCGVPCECGRGNYLPVYARVAVDEIRRLRESVTRFDTGARGECLRLQRRVEMLERLAFAHGWNESALAGGEGEQ